MSDPKNKQEIERCPFCGGEVFIATVEHPNAAEITGALVMFVLGVAAIMGLALM